MLEFLLGLSVTMFVIWLLMMTSYYVVIGLIQFFKLDKTDWFNLEENELMSKETLKKYILPTASVIWVIGVFFLGWKAILWTCIGVAIGTLINKLKEETRI
jgi:hypothetical protein